MTEELKSKRTAASSVVLDKELKLLEAKRKIIFERLQNIFDSSKIIHTNEDVKEGFLSSISTLRSLREEFKNLLDQYNDRLLTLNPDATPNYNSLISFEELYGRILHINSQLTNSDKETLPSKSRPSLPPIELMSFDGDIRSWPLFYASFKSTIHDNRSLTDSEKLYYLLGKISGKAQAACAGITPCADNYNLLFQTLVDKYDDKRMLASAYLDQILEFKNIVSASPNNYELFINKFVSAVRGLKNLKINDLTDFIILHIAIKKLDSDTMNAFEQLNDSSIIPSFDNLVLFIQNQCKILQRTLPRNSIKKPSDRVRVANSSNPTAPKYQTYTSTVNSTTFKCLCSNITHQHLFKCPSFNQISPSERFKLVKDQNACVNCLSIKHKVSLCNSNSTCRVCNSRHHTLLHFNISSHSESNLSRAAGTAATVPKGNARAHPAPVAAPNTSIDRSDVALCSTYIDSSPAALTYSSMKRDQCTMPKTVLLATAQVIVYDAQGTSHLVRCLLDSASQSNFITKKCCNRLNISPKNIPQTIVKGIGGSEKFIKGAAAFQFSSRYNSNIKFDISSLVVDQITDSLPSALIDRSALSYLDNLPLADDMFATPNNIDILIGASLFPHLLLPGVVHSNSSAPPAIETVLGYIIMGSVPTLHAADVLTTCCAIESDTTSTLDNFIKKFWELEELSCPPVQCADDIECETFYCTTTERDPASGRYSVALPFRDDVFLLGDSYNTAYKRFLCLERKLESSPRLRLAYDNVINEYLLNDYIAPAVPDTASNLNSPSYIIPHHGVIREDKTTTKLRVVLDASCKTTSGVDLNSILHTGPNLQGDLFQIILNFRLFAVALTADCRQMFLQIAVRENDRRFQRILYRFNSNDPINIYEFKRVCFGLKSSPYHALRTVKQLISDEGDMYPAACEIASSSLYMDDLVFSVRTEGEGVTAATQLIGLFKSAQWDLVKWSTNSRLVSQSLPASHRLLSDLEFDEINQHKILGLHWSHSTDAFYFKICTPSDTCTKRTILSTIARLWDIMGFVAPTILYAKLLIRQIWLLKLDWDDHLPPHIIKIWKQYCSELPALNQFNIPRHLGVADGCTATLLGFSDASELAYGAVIYMHIQSGDISSIQLVCAKSKVAPIKTVSIARLELCAAVLLSKLLRIIHDNYNPRFKINVLAFTDSKVVLYWIKSSPHRWQTFVANRVVTLNDNISSRYFHHVSGPDNPADCLSRGLTPFQLLKHPLWLHGPHWALNASEWPIHDAYDYSNLDIPEQKALSHTALTINEDSLLYTLAHRMSSWTKLLRTIAYIFKFIKILPRNKTSSITLHDLDFAENKLIRSLQQKYFAEEFNNLEKGKNSSPALQKLMPFIDNGVIRVGGRLSNSDLNFTQKHPIVLPRHDHIVDLLIDYYHKKYLHAGPELLMSILRQRYWIFSARRIIRRRIHKCIKCFKLKPRSTFPLMADLPASRVTPSLKAFTHTGCDYAGPISYVPIRRRGARSHKAYLCIFTCLTTRAVHIELATDLSTDSFIAALKRFLARRGPVQYMYSDNGRNFIGARSYLKELYSFLDNEYKLKLEEELLENRITWKFIPPASPHFGGCWESMVKIIKTHLFKVIGQQLLSYEELSTILIQIEALLNSRPLTALSSDPSEPRALTPSHFLYAVPLNSLPAHAVDESHISLSQRHSLIDKLIQSFWKRWRSEYLHRLQARQKWNTGSTPVQIGTVVIIINNNAPPLSWPLGVIEKVHPSKDGITRVVSVKTAKGTFLRPVVRLCPLPNQ